MVCKTQLCTTCGTWLAILVYMSEIHAFPPLYGICWQDKSVDKDRQQTPPSLPFARPRAKAKVLVVDQELLLCRLFFTSAMLIPKCLPGFE